MKTLNKFILSALLAAALAPFAYAADEPAMPDGNRGLSALGVVRFTTNTATESGIVTEETRRLRTNDNGDLKTIFTTRRTSFTRLTTELSSNVFIMDGIDSSTTTFYRNSTGTIFFSNPELPGITTNYVNLNPNVYCIGASSAPCTNLRIVLGESYPLTTASTASVRIFDSRGSTAAAYRVWEGFISTATAIRSVSFDHEFSSGITTMIHGSAAGHFWNPPKFNSQGLTR